MKRAWQVCHRLYASSEDQRGRAALLEYKQWHTRTAGFTLIEVLLASILTAVLVAALWNLLSMYVRLFETGHTKTEQSQLARTLLRQVESDLHATLPVVRPDRRTSGSSAPDGGNDSSSTGGVASKRTASLRGTRDSLELVILEAVAPASDAVLPTDAAPPRVPELRRVVYRFVEPIEGGRVDRRSLPGLLRREAPWASGGSGPFAQRPTRSPTVAGADSAQGGAALDGAALDGAALDGEALDGAASLPDVPADNTVLHAPEVIGMALRYFDGANWSDGWDSLARQTLPVAVEITLQVRAFDDLTRAGRAAAEARKAQSPTAIEDDPRRPVYRLVTYLATGERIPETMSGQRAQRGQATHPIRSASP